MSERVTSPRCPRCGYDQSGEIASWTDRCPVRGICTECGLSFPWRDLLDPRFGPPLWSFEHAAMRRPRALAITLARTLRPGRFWQEMRLTFEVSVARLALLAIAPIVIAHALLGAGVYVSQRIPLRWFSDSIAEILLWPYGRWMTVGGSWTYAPDLVLWWVGAIVPMFLGMLVLAHTLRKARVRRAHLLRAVAYAVPQAVLLSMLAGLASSTLIWLVESGRINARGWGTIESKLYAGAEALLTAAYILWLGHWWWRMTDHYLRLDHARLVALAMTIITALTVFIAFAMLYRDEFARLFFVW